MSNVSNKVFSHTHYGVSTIAAVLYACAWLLGNQVRAEIASDTAVLPAIVVTGHQLVTTTLAPIVVTGYRTHETERYATLAPVIVHATRDTASVVASTVRPVVATTGFPIVSASSDSAPRGKGLIAKARNWLASALLK
jgi:hypothetical protein